MSDPLRVSPDGLHSASVELGFGAVQLSDATTTSGATSGKPSGEGIRRAAAAVAALGAAYHARMDSHAQAALTAAANYTRTDSCESDAVARTL
ncbi:hypothetical protein QWI29_17725 [Mycolicibacterium neoaurum]|uniref:hypothetical protein n=1 Tax=Mycolicibacterium neoaurum TaxID=1795 RepID=UPI0026728E0C|nr:hypothetical protein [Mycolicibacterium neoaurum]MDO3401884.1 hypothetical protein [Mycolicibacterium neoaurum]